MAVEGSVTIYRGEAVPLNFTNNVPITGWTIKFSVSKKQDSTSEKLIGPMAVVVLDASAGTYRVVLTEELTDLKAGSYFFDVWRTDEGFEEVLAIGSFIVSGNSRVPPIE